jgi:nicotinate dehydrogenase subunit A
MRICVNGQGYEVSTEPETPLLFVLRNDLELNGPKYGCGLGQCGACTVIVAGKAARSCILPVGGLRGRPVTTIEGLASAKGLDPVQQAFIAENGTQCGYCLNGMIMTMRALLDRVAQPTEAEIRAELRFNLCRCGAHMEILRAARHAVTLVSEAQQG